MSFVSLKEFQEYTSSYDKESLQREYIDSAIDIVTDYLGYDAELKTYSRVFNGTGTNELRAGAKPIRLVFSLKIDNISISGNDIYFKDSEFIYLRHAIFPAGINNIEVEYTAGYENNDMPNILKTTVLRIGAILQAEGDNNIAVSSKSFGDSGNRVFMNYTNFDKYLLPISSYKLLRI
jgi:hypothetical protein